MTLKEKQEQIIDDFSLYEEWLDKYEYLIELGKATEAQFPLLMHIDDIINGGKPVNIPWNSFEVEF